MPGADATPVPPPPAPGTPAGKTTVSGGVIWTWSGSSWFANGVLDAPAAFDVREADEI